MAPDDCAQRGPKGIKALRAFALETIEWISLQKSHKAERALSQVAGSAPHGAWDVAHQVAEFQVHVAMLNGHNAPGIPVKKLMG